MAKGQKRSSREAKKPKSKKTTSTPVKSATLGLFAKGTTTSPASASKKS